jgi:hypothetical protein
MVRAGWPDPEVACEVLSFWTVFLVIFGRAHPIGGYQPEGFTTPTPFYLLCCFDHGFYTTYRQGLEQTLPCPACVAADVQKAEQL